MARSYLIDRLIPSNEISFVFGSPGAGKSTFLCHLGTHLIAGKPFEFAGRVFSTSKIELGYAAYDRSTDSIGDLLTKYGLQDKIQWRSYRNVSKPDGSDQRKIEDIPADFPNCSTIIIDGLGLTIPTGKTNEYCIVGNYVRYCGTVAERYQRTLLATLHSPKARLGEGISNPRMGALGSIAFPGIGEAMMQVEHSDLTKPEDPNRFIRIMPHDGPALQSNWMFTDTGLLIECQDPTAQADDNDLMLSLLTLLPHKFSSSEAVQMADGLAISRRSTYRYLSALVDLGKIIQVKHGHYEKCGQA